MLVYRRTSILESSAQTLVNTVNCVGVMGKGIAKEFKAREPAMFEAYKKICDEKLLSPGKLWLWRGELSWVLNFPTKVHWRNPSKIEWIEAGLRKFVDSYASKGIHEISFPRLGCGNGGLDWDEVRPIMEHHLSPLPIPVFIHDHEINIGLPEHLEQVADTLKANQASEVTFEKFVADIRKIIELTKGNLVDLDTDQIKPFKAELVSDCDLRIEVDNTSCLFEADALRAVWVGLHRGLVSEKKAASPVGCGGKQLLSLVSVLPQVRAVQIQRKNESPELAVEFRPEQRRIALAPLPKEQNEFACH